jgi:hypothetical protein
MLEIPPKEIIGSYITDIEYHSEGTGELLTFWIRLTDGRLVSIIPVSCVSKLTSCPFAEESHGGSLNVLRKDDPLIGATITDVDIVYNGFFSSGELTTLWMRLCDKRFVMVSPTFHNFAVCEGTPLLEKIHGGIKTTGDLVRSRVQTPGDLAEMLTDNAKNFIAKEGGLTWINRNKHMNDYDGEFEINEHNVKLVDAALVGFINYVASQYCMDYGLYTRDLYGERE